MSTPSRKFTLLEIESVIRNRIGAKPMHRFVNVHRNELTHSEEVIHIELTFDYMTSFYEIEKALTGLHEEASPVYGRSWHGWTDRGVWINRAWEASFRCEVRGYGGLVNYTRILLSPLEEEKPRPIIQAGIMWDEGPEYFEHYIADDRR